MGNGLNLFVFLATLGFTLAASSAPWRASDWPGTTELHLGLLATAGAICPILLSPMFGRTIEQRGTLGPLRIGCLGSTAAMVLMGLCTTTNTLALTLIMFGLAQAIFWPAVAIELGQQGQSGDLAKRLGGFNVSWCVGAAIGGAILGRLHEIRPWWPFVSGAFFAVLAWAVCSLSAARRPDRNYISTHLVEPIDNSPALSVPPLLLYTSWAANSVAWFSTVTMIHVLPALARSAGVVGWEWGALLFVLNGTQALVFALLWCWRGWIGKPQYIALAALLASAGCMAIAFAKPLLWWMGGLAALGAFNGLAITVCLYYTLWAPQGRGLRAGKNESITVIGATSGVLLGGMLANYVWRPAPYLLCATLLIAVAAIHFAIRHEQHISSS